MFGILRRLFGKRDDSYIVITDGDGEVSINGRTYTVKEGEPFYLNQTDGQAPTNLGPEVTQTFTAEPQDSVKLTKEAAASLLLKHFDGDITVEVTPEVMAPVVEVTGPQRLVEAIKSQQDGRQLKLTASRFGSSLNVVAIARAVVSSISTSTPKLTIVAKVPPSSQLTLDDVSGNIVATGVLLSLDATLGYDTTATFGEVDQVTLKTDSSCTVSFAYVGSWLTADLEYDSKLTVKAGGVIEACRIDCDSSCRADVRARVTHLTADLEYDSKLFVNSAAEVILETDSGCEVVIGKVEDTLTADLEYDSKLTVEAGPVRTANIKTDSGCTVSIGSPLTKLDAQLEYDSKLEIGGSVDHANIKTDSSCKVTVHGEVKTGQLTAEYDTRIKARAFGSRVDTSGVDDSASVRTM